jgi:Domain of unknown function (DUF4112)
MTNIRQRNDDSVGDNGFAHSPRLKRMRGLSRVLDSAFVIPGTKQRMGLDPILGLIPGGGDTVSAALSSYIIIEAAMMGLPRSSLMRMVVNLALDTVVGSVPILGDVFDLVSKANLRNMQIVENHAKSPHASARVDKLFIIGLIVGLIILIAVVGAIMSWLLILLATAFG